MQSNLFEPQQLPELPQPGAIEHWLFEATLLPAGIAAALGIIAFLALRNTEKARRVGLPLLVAGLLLAAGIYAAGAVVVTDREHLSHRSEQLVIAAAAGDATGLSELLGADVRLQSVFATVTGREPLIALAETRAARVVESVEVSDVNAGLYGAQVARTQIRVRVQTQWSPSLSWWAVDWKRPTADSDAWVATHIEPIWVQGFDNPGAN